VAGVVSWSYKRQAVFGTPWMRVANCITLTVITPDKCIITHLYSSTNLIPLKSTFEITFIIGMLETLHYMNKSNFPEDQWGSWEINMFLVSNNL
jgi:hypothetical protein